MANRSARARGIFDSSFRAAGAGLAALALTAGCGGTGGAGGESVEEPAGVVATGAPAAAELAVHDARVIEVPGMASVYLTVDNSGPEADRLLRVETPATARAEMHETIDDDGVMRMRPRPDGFEVPAGGSLALEPGGRHVMLIDPALPAGGALLPVTLHFERAGALEIEAPVTALAGDSSVDHSAHGGHGGHGGHGEQDHDEGHDQSVDPGGHEAHGHSGDHGDHGGHDHAAGHAPTGDSHPAAHGGGR